MIGQHDQLLRALVDSNQSMSTHVYELSRQVSSLASTVLSSMPPPPEAISVSTPPQDSHLSDPDLFFGDLDKCLFFFYCSVG